MAFNQSHISIVPISLLLLGLILILGSVPKTKVRLSTTQMELVLKADTDSIRYEIWLVSDLGNQPDHYYGEIFTPVCYSRTCFPVFINFRWDLLGNYQKFELPKKKVLTKSDHLEFDKAEYEKLQEILFNDNSILKNYKADQLVSSTESINPTGVDAVTGATVKSIQKEVISGAVYSCYTLWHIAHGDISEKLKQHTETYLVGDDLLIRFLESSNFRYQYWAIDKALISGQIQRELFKKPLFGILNQENVFASNYLLKQLSPEIFNNKEEQLVLLESFSAAPYPLQISILKKYSQIKLIPETTTMLIQHLPETNDEQKRFIFSLLAKEKKLDDLSQKNLAGFLSQPKWEEDAYRILINQNNLSQGIKGELTAYAGKYKTSN